MAEGATAICSWMYVVLGLEIEVWGLGFGININCKLFMAVILTEKGPPFGRP
jgi:hypothetical protein